MFPGLHQFSAILLSVECVVWRGIFKFWEQPFNGPLSRTTRVSQYQKGKTNLHLLKHETVSGIGISLATCEINVRSKAGKSQLKFNLPHGTKTKPDMQKR